MQGITLNFANQEEYNRFIEQVKKDVLNDVKSVPAYSASWIKIREDLEKKLRGEFNYGCGQWYQNQMGLYAMFRLAFQKESIKNLRYVDGDSLTEFYKEIIELIEKWREKGEKENESIQGIGFTVGEVASATRQMAHRE